MSLRDPPPVGQDQRRSTPMATGTLNIAQLLRQRREGKIPASAGGGVLGGSTRARGASAWLRGAGGGGGIGPPGFGFRRNVGQHPSVIARLRHTATLRGHTGCVNRLCWNDSGTRIASGSDDTTVCLFDAASGKRDLRFRTGHRRNILSVKILPCTNDQVVVTGAMDGEVRLHKAPFTSAALTDSFSCHSKRVYAVEVEPGNPFVFWSASEDGTVRQFDRRLPGAGCREPSGSGDDVDDCPGARLQRTRLGAANCLIKIPPPVEPGGCVGGRSSSLRQHQQSSGSAARGAGSQSGRAFHIACNPVDTNHLAVACGDYIARVYDRRVLSLGQAGGSSGRNSSSSSYGRPPALSLCPTNEHPSAGRAPVPCAPGGGVEGGRAPSSPFGSGRHATCVAYSPDGKALLVSYHRDHVYLFDATGARKDSSAVSDPALSSYFMPTPPPLPLPPPSPSLLPTAPGHSPVGSGSGGGGGNPNLGGRGSGGRVRVGTRRGGAGRAGGTLEAADEATARVLEAHRALTLWDGRGEPPVSLLGLSGLYRRRSRELRERGWRGDGYMALLDAARAKELSPLDPEVSWEYVEALVHVERRPAARSVGLRCVRYFPELRPRFESIFWRGPEKSQEEKEQEEAEHEEEEEEEGEEEEEEEEEEDEEKEDGAGDTKSEEVASKEEVDGKRGFLTPSRKRERAVGVGHDRRGDRGLGKSDGSDAGRPRRLCDRDCLEKDLTLSAEIEVSRGWYEKLSRIGGAESDSRCRRGDSPVPAAAAVADRASASSDWTEVECTQRSPDMVDCSPRAMIQRYAGACNVQTVIKEASFLGDDGGYVASGSDDGRVFIWERASGRLVRAIKADEQIVNCVAPHPSLPVLATSGLESVVRLWSPRGEAQTVIGEEGPAESDLDSSSLEEIVQSNQGDMNAVGVNLEFQPLMHQLVLQLAAADSMADDGGPGECVQA